MNVAIKKALEVLVLHGLSSSYIDIRQITSIIDKEFIIYNNFPFKGRLKERYICTSDGIAQISIMTDSDIPEKKHLIAHALGHHYLHKGNYAYIDDISLDKQEKQAEDFAAMLLVPPDALKQSRPSTVEALAEEFSIPIKLAIRRLNIYKQVKI